MDDKPAVPNENIKSGDIKTSEGKIKTDSSFDNKFGWLSGDYNKPASAESESSADVGAQPPASPFMSPTPVDPSTQEQKEIEPQLPPEHALTSDPIVGPHSSSDGKGFKIFMIIGVFVILAVWAGVFYLYMQNKDMKKTSSQEEIVEDIPVATPTPEFTPDQIKIKGGNIIREKTTGEVFVLIDKENFESTGITGFLKVAVSPDEKKMCFESWSPAPEPALYISDIDGQNVIEVSANRQNCLWSKDSMFVYYINTATRTTPVNIFSYDILQDIEIDLTGESVPPGTIRRYELVGLTADGTKLICKYENLEGIQDPEIMSECEIDLETKEVNIF